MVLVESLYFHLYTYNKLLHDNITKTYKHGSEDNISEINNELKHIANKLSIGNRIECMKKREAFWKQSKMPAN